jgi:predicted KAP-like P-loop ATPase
MEFISDEPITKKKQDILHRSNFSSKFGDALINWTGDESLVIGLYGEWGSGKSSIVNLAIDEVRRNSSKKNNPPLIVSFNPWNFTEQNQLISIFLQELSKAFNYKDPAGEAFQIGKELLTYSKFFIPLASMIPGAYPFTQIIQKAFNEVGTASKEWGELKTKSLEELKKKLDNKIKKLGRKVIIVIDDIDRLNQVEIRQIFQLVKLNANFPNTLYLLSFDEKKVSSALEEPHFSGKEYLEKIVQIPISVPSIESDKLEEIFITELNKTVKPFTQETENMIRWGNLYYGRLQNFFTSIRQIKRYINGLKFNIQILPNEINTIDFIGIEAIRVFSPDVYREISKNKELFTDLTSRNTRESEDKKKVLEAIFEKTDESIKKIVQEVVIELFPPIGNVYGRSSYSHEFQNEWHKQKRICAPDRFASYFLFAVPAKVIPQEEVDVIIAAAYDSNKVESLMKVFNKKKMAKSFLHRGSEFLDKIKEEDIEPFLIGIFNPSDKYPHETRGMYDEHIRLALWRVALNLLRKVKDENTRLNIAENLIKKSKSLGAIITFVSLEEPTKETKHEVILKPENHAVLKTLTLDKIRKMSKLKNFAKIPDLLNILYRWKDWAGIDEPKKYVEDLVNTNKGLSQFLLGCVTPITSHGMEDHVAVTKWKINKNYINEFIDVNSLKARVENMNKKERESLTVNENIALDLFIESFSKTDIFE